MDKPLALVIEDYTDQAVVFSRALEMAGFATERIEDGDVAQARLAEVVPALIVLDLHIPGTSGDVLLNQIRADARLAKIPVLIATADAFRANELQPLADFVFLKPVSFIQMREMAERIRGSLPNGGQ